MSQREQSVYVVTGGAGFVGSHLVERLLSAYSSAEIIVVDNLSTGRESNLANIRPKVTFLEADIVDPHCISQLQSIIKDRPLAGLIHLACIASPPEYQRHSIETLRTCFEGTRSMLELCCAHRRTCRLVFSSTSEVYGDPAEHPQSESYRGNVNCVGPRACYDEGKRVAETLCVEYSRQYALDIRIARIFNTYGPRMRANDGRVICSFLPQARQNQPISIYGDGTSTRSFMYIDDLVDGLMALLELPQPGLIGPVNLGNPHEEYSIQQVADIIKQLTGNTRSVAYLPSLPDDPVRRKPNIALARQLLKWEPRVTLLEGLQRIMQLE